MNHSSDTMMRPAGLRRCLLGLLACAAMPAWAAQSATPAPPFSPVVRAGDFLFLAGQLGTLPDGGGLAGVDIEAQARQSLRNIQRVLESNGAGLQDVVKCTVFLADMAEWGTFNAVYREFFRAPFPARSAVGVAALALDARVEVECLAYKPAP
jgi:reactive intermediate/imine deaminase